MAVWTPVPQRGPDFSLKQPALPFDFRPTEVKRGGLSARDYPDSQRGPGPSKGPMSYAYVLYAHFNRICLVRRTGVVGEIYIDDVQVGVGQSAQEDFTLLNVMGKVYVGGLPLSVSNPPLDVLKTGLVGCLRGLVIESVNVDLVSDATDGLNVESCVSVVCSAHSDCQNGGTCVSSSDGSKCLCQYGFIGDNCELGALRVLISS